MEQKLLEMLYANAVAIVKETNEKIVKYPRNAIEVYYGISLENLPENAFDLESLDEKKGHENTKKLKKLREESVHKALYASEAMKLQAAEIGKIIQESAEKIKMLYKNALDRDTTLTG